MSNSRYLEKHGNQYRVQVPVPRKLQAAMGKKKLVAGLHTDSLANANRVKFDVVARLKAEIAAFAKTAKSSVDPLIGESLSWRDSIATEKPRPVTATDWNTGEVVEAEEWPIRDELLQERAQEIEKERGAGASEAFVKIATGEATPITSLIDLWLAERGDMKPRQHTDYRRAVQKFATWLPTANLSATIETTSRKIAGRYVSEAMVGKGVHPKTANKDVSALSGYWKWLMKRGHTESNPWSGQSLSKKLAPKAEKRPFTDDEVKALLQGTEDVLLLDAMKVAALSGMRLEEIASLRVSDVAQGVFDVRAAKTEAGVRRVPIHSELRRIVAVRVEGKRPDAFLFHELGKARTGNQERGQGITKKFGRYREDLGIHEKPEGQRQSNVDFHSFRRWFIAKARDALRKGAKGFDPWTIAQVVGHDTKGGGKNLAMTMGVYAGEQGAAAKVACIEAVTLPR